MGCRRQGAKTDLVRLVWREGGVRPDLGQVRPGRGAYLHSGAGCLELALKRRALGRALRVTAVEPDQLRGAWTAAGAEPRLVGGAGADTVFVTAAPPVLT